jgi:putative inorganic carbon (HCO3(-)) transporter
MAKAASKTSNRKPSTKAPAGMKRTAAVPPDDMSLALKIAWFALLAMVFLVPVAMSNVTWLSRLGFANALPFTYDQFDIVKVFLQRVLTLVALGAWSWELLTKGGKIRRTPVDWLILGFLAWVALTTITSIHPPTAFFGKYRRFEGLLSFINYAVIYFLVLQFADRPSRVKALAQSLFASSVVVAGYGVLQRIGADPIQWGQLPFEQFRPFSTYGNPDLLGGYLMFSLPVALGLALAEEKLWMRLLYWAGFGVNVFVCIIAFTRGAWIGGLVGVAIMIVIAWRHSAKMTVVDWVPVGLTGVFGVSAIVRSLSNPNEVMNFATRFASITNFESGSGQTRTQIWQAALAAVKARPLFGFGADTFRLVFPSYKPIEYVGAAGYLSVADNVHNYPLQLASGIGIPGVAMLYGIFGWAAVRSFGTVFNKTDDRKRILIGAFWAACAGYLVQLMAGLSVTGNTFLLWTAIAVVLAPTASVVEFESPNWGNVVAGVLMFLIAVGISYQFVIIAADQAYLTARIGAAGAARTAAARKAVQLNPFNDMYRAEVGLALTDEVFDAFSTAQSAQAQGQDPGQAMAGVQMKFQQAEAALLETIAFVPNEYDNYVFLSNLYNVAGQMINPSYYEKAVAIADKGVLIENYGPALRVQRARALVALNRNEEALKDAEFAVKMDPNYNEATLLLSNIYKSLGRRDDALKVLVTFNGTYKPGQPEIESAIAALEASASPTSTPTKP